jgi:hypothetical protein
MPKTRRPAQWELHTIPADIVRRLPDDLAEFVTETLRHRAYETSKRSKAGREYAAACLAALTALEN